MNWYFTFMFKQSLLKNRYVKLSGSCKETCSRLYNVIGDKWGMQYDEQQFMPQIVYFHLTEITLDELENHPQLLAYYDE
jgi:hypothetical protein